MQFLINKFTKNFKCACHRLHTVIKTVWETTQIEQIVELERSITKLMSFVSHKVDLQARLPVKIKATSQTRAWRGLVEKLDRIDQSYDALRSELAKINKEILIVSVDRQVLHAVLEVLRPLKSIFDKLELSKSPSIQNVLPSFHLLQSHFSSPSEETFIGSLKKEFLSCLHDKFSPIIKDEHFMASFLSPRLKTFSFIKDKKERDDAINHAKKLIKIDPPQLPTIICDVEPKAKKPFDLFESIEPQQTVQQISMSEVDKYSEFVNAEPIDPLSFWKSQTSLPQLQNFAQSLFAIQASSSLSERIFSYGGMINSPSRSSLSPETLCGLISLASYLKEF